MTNQGPPSGGASCLDPPPCPGSGPFTYRRRCCACWRRRGTFPAWVRTPASPDARSSSRGHGSTWKGHGRPGGACERAAPGQGLPGGPAPPRPRAPLLGRPLTSRLGPRASGSPRRRSSSRSRCTAAPASPSSARSSPQTAPGSRQPGPLRGGGARPAATSGPCPQVPSHLSQTPPLPDRAVNPTSPSTWPPITAMLSSNNIPTTSTHPDPQCSPHCDDAPSALPWLPSLISTHLPACSPLLLRPQASARCPQSTLSPPIPPEARGWAS